LCDPGPGCGPPKAWICVRQVEALKAALAAAGKTAEFKCYPRAPHGFHADYRASYRKEAAEDAWSPMPAWFKKYNVPGRPELRGHIRNIGLIGAILDQAQKHL
jgi:acetyl esterase/lipase